MDWVVFSYLGLAFAILYRVPQIVKIYRTKSAGDLSVWSYMAHNGAYISFILYLVGEGRISQDWALCFYYFMGISQNILIFAMVRYYRRRGREGAADDEMAVAAELETAVAAEEVPAVCDGGGGRAPAFEGHHNSRGTYAQRRRWFKCQVKPEAASVRSTIL